MKSKPCGDEVHEDHHKQLSSRQQITSSMKTQVISAPFDLFLYRKKQNFFRNAASTTSATDPHGFIPEQAKKETKTCTG